MFKAKARQNESEFETGFGRTDLTELQKRVNAIRNSWSETERRVRARMGQRQRAWFLRLYSTDAQLNSSP